jgi:hypothetical protein
MILVPFQKSESRNVPCVVRDQCRNPVGKGEKRLYTKPRLALSRFQRNPTWVRSPGTKPEAQPFHIFSQDNNVAKIILIKEHLPGWLDKKVSTSPKSNTKSPTGQGNPTA